MNGLILDVIVIAVAVLLIIFGIWRGFYKLIFGLVSGIAALVIAIVLCSTVTSFAIDKTQIDEKLKVALDEQIQNAVPAEMNATDVQITISTDGTIKIANEKLNQEYESITECLSETPYKMFGGILDSVLKNQNALKVLYPDMGKENAEPAEIKLSELISSAAVVYIMLACVFVILWIVAYIVIRLIMFLIKKLVNATYIGHFIDKVLGMVVGAAIALVLIWGVLAVIRLLGSQSWILPAEELINSSTVTKFLYEKNVLFNLLVQNTNIQELIGNLLSGVGGSTEKTTEQTKEAISALVRS